MHVRSFTLPLAALIAAAAMVSLSADASGLRQKQAMIRISLTVLDNCEIELASHTGPPSPDGIQVACSDFMPYRSSTTQLAAPDMTPGTAAPSSIGETLPVKAQPPAIADGRAQVSVTTVTF